MSRTARLGVILLATVIAGALSSGPAGAQYFGSNKVQYETFDFRILQTRHFDIYYYPQEQEGALYAARLAERWYARYAEALRHQLHDRQPLILYASHPDFSQTNLVEGLPGEGTGGLTEGSKRRIVMSFGVGLGETNHVLARHGNGGILAMPLWFIEGMAEFLSLGSNDGLTAMWMRDIVRQGRLPSIKDLEQPRFFPYRYGQALWGYLAKRFGDDIVRKLLTARGDTVRARLKAVTGLDEARLTRDWHDSLRAAFPAAAAANDRGGTTGLHRIVAASQGGRLNLAPSLSPDGSRLTFLSERDRFSVDLYLADARTGAIRRKIISTATDPHFDSLQFIDSAGAWDPAGRRFVFAAVASGKPVLVIVDPLKGTTEREIRFDDLGQVFQPTWSPDGRQIAFCGLRSGLSDIYVYDLASRQTRRLTFDPYTDVQPAWSPDGQQIAFVTDRFSTDIRALRFGVYQVALIDVDSGDIRRVPGFAGVRSVDPQWAPDGRSLYFIADPARVTNVYRVDLAADRVYQVTDVPVGVSGITQLSPALTVARDSRKVAFSLYTAGNYEIYEVSAAEAVLGRPVDPSVLAAVPDSPDQMIPTGSLEDLMPVPPLEPAAPRPTPLAATAVAARAVAQGPKAGEARGEPGERDGNRHDPRHPDGAAGAAGSQSAASSPDRTQAAANDGAAAADLTVKRYRRSLSLDGMGQPYFTAGGGQFGSFFRAGMSFSLGDMLRDQLVDTAIQVGRHAEDFAGRAIYLNRRSRWNWGAEVEYLPLVFAQSGVSLSPDMSEVATRVDYLRQVHRGISALASYPFSRANRLEFAGGFRSLTFARDLQTQVMALATGSTVSDTQTSLPAARPVNLFESSAAFVHDTAVLGPTSPILGSRYRLEVSPALGTLTFATVLADYRRYLVPVKPFTLAFRARYLGRHGPDAADSRLLPLVLGLRDDVRGYDLGTLLGDPCTAEEMLRGCSALERLNDSRLVVANAEVRFPLKGLLTRSFDYGPLPLEGLVFADAGKLWRQVTAADGASSAWQHNLLRSIGAGVRLNAGGVVFEFDAVRRFDTPAHGWTFFFNLLPGF